MLRFLFSILVVLPSVVTAVHAVEPDHSLQPYSKNPFYWQYKGKPVLLLGGSKDDNLFQLPDLKSHLDEIKNAGGNIIRNTMSDRPDKGFEVYPFRRLENGNYDLNQFNEEYWSRFARMLKWTYERDIIVQIEIWDRFDYADHRGDRWLLHPFNPRNNINYTQKETGLKPTYRRHPGSNENPFFFTVPALKNNLAVLRFQQARVDKMLSYTFQYPHVLYCMDNETSGSAEWGRYWATYIKQKSKEQNTAKRGVVVQTTEMWDSWNLNHPHHRATFDHPETYSFVDISQNNHQKGQQHWDNMQRQRKRIRDVPRPLNNVKIYGANGGPFGNQRDALERFWRNIIGGAASSRFHRPPAGLGLSAVVQAHLKSARLLTAELDIFASLPDARSKLLSNRSANEAYLTCIPGKQYAVIFPDGGSVGLDLSAEAGRFRLKWLDISHSRWFDETTISAGGNSVLKAPKRGFWVALLTKSTQ